MERTLFEFPKDATGYPQGPCYIETVNGPTALVVEVDTGRFHGVSLRAIENYATVVRAKQESATPSYTLRQVFDYLTTGLSTAAGGWVCIGHYDVEFLENKGILVAFPFSTRVNEIYTLSNIKDLFSLLGVSYEQFINQLEV
jgi:hypothetical protein